MAYVTPEYYKSQISICVVCTRIHLPYRSLLYRGQNTKNQQQTKKVTLCKEAMALKGQVWLFSTTTFRAVMTKQGWGTEEKPE